MSYTLKREGEEERDHAASAYVKQPVSLHNVAMGVGIGSVIMFSLAGVPSFSRARHLPPAGDGLSHALELTCYADLQRICADLIQPVDPQTFQRPAYPTADELFARLLPIDHWTRAALFAVDVSVDELQAAGLGSREACLKLNLGAADGMANPFGLIAHWQLVLLDHDGNSLGRTFLAAPTLEVERFDPGEDDLSAYPVLEPRFPDWPRVTVFNRPAGVSPSEG